MAQNDIASARGLETNKVLRDTYRLLAMTLLVASGSALLTMTLNLPNPYALAASATGTPLIGTLVVLAVWFFLLFMIEKNANSSAGIAWVFVFAAFTGYMAGGLVDIYLTQLGNGSAIVATALGATAATFFAASVMARNLARDFGGVRRWLFPSIFVAFIAGIIGVVFQLPTLMLLVSGAFAVLMTWLILWQTSEIVHGRETNYIRATINLYVALYNLFTSLMHIFGVFGDE